MKFRTASVKSHRGQKGLLYLDFHSKYPEAMYMPKTHVSLVRSAEIFQVLLTVCKVNFWGLHISFFAFVWHRRFTVSVPDFKVSINCIIFRMCEARCLHTENQNKLCQKTWICAILYLFHLCKWLSCLHTFAIQMQLECVHMKMWHYVGIHMQWYILFSGQKIAMVNFFFKYKLLLKQNKTKPKSHVCIKNFLW